MSNELENVNDLPDEMTILAESLGSLDSDLDVEVYEVDDEGMVYLFAFPVGSMTTRQIMDKIRGEVEEGKRGKFQIQARTKKGTWAMRKQVRVKGLGGNVSRETPVAVPAGGGLSEVAALMRENMHAMQTMVLQMQVKSSEQMVDVLKELAGRGGAGQAPDILGMVALLKELSPRQDDPIKVLLQGMTLGKELGEVRGGGSSDGLGGVLEKLGVPLMELVAAQQAASAQKPIVPMQSEPVGQVEKMSVPRETMAYEQPEEEEVLMKKMIAAAVDKFVNMADSGNAPGEAAAVFVERYGAMVPDEMLSEEGLEKLKQSFPEVAARAEWFGAMWKEIEKKIFE